MSYQFTKHEPVAEGARRIVCEEVAAAMERLQAKTVRERDEAIHEVRKAVKRVRGLLKLMRPVLGDAYEKEAKEWRDLGRRLSALRDAGAMVGAFDELRGQCSPRLYGAIRRRLLGDRRAMSGDVSGTMATVAAGLKRAEKRLKSWQIEGEGFGAIAPGLEQTYRNGWRALRTARRDPTPENLHELRKRTKEHLFQLRLLEVLWDGKLQRHEARVKRLDEILGSHQNLAVLRTKILEQPEDVEKFLSVVDRIESGLAKEALELGEQVYEEPASRITKRVKHLWQH